MSGFGDPSDSIKTGIHALYLLPAVGQRWQAIGCFMCVLQTAFFHSFLLAVQASLSGVNTVKQPPFAVSILAFAQSAIFDSTSKAFANSPLLTVHIQKREQLPCTPNYMRKNTYT